MASWAYCRNRSASVMTVSCLGDALFPSALPDVLGTLNTEATIGRRPRAQWSRPHPCEER